jgi:beta-glucanase (GH16 family)
MRISRLLAVGMLCGILSIASPPEGYKLLWADEFNGSSLDHEKWGYRRDCKHWSTQLPANVSVAGGHLVLELKNERSAGMEYTGAGIISKPAFRFGYYEARFRIDAGKGWHSSFWMMGHDGSGGTGTAATELELDVIENDSIDLTSYGVNVHKWQGKHQSIGHKKVAARSLSDFHVFGCEYTPQTVKYFLDGQVVQTVDVSSLPHGDLHIWLTSIASHLGKTDAVDDSRLPGHIYFDYVRFYEKGK